MKTKHIYETALETIQCLRKEGYTLDFKLEENCIFCKEVVFQPHDFEVINVFRFEGNEDPIDDAVVYAIESKNNQRGILVTTNAIFYGPVSEILMTKLDIREYTFMKAS